MIDDPQTTQALLEQMQQQLPIPIYAGNMLLRLLEKNGLRVKPRQLLHIAHVIYAGDEGGISCGLSGLPTKDNTVYHVSLTHLKVAPETPLKEAIQAYQQTRTRRLQEEALRHAIPSLKQRH